MIDKDKITLSQLCFIQVKIRSTSFKELQVQTDEECGQKALSPAES